MRKKQYPDKVRKPRRKRKKSPKTKRKHLLNTVRAVEDTKPIPVKKTANILSTSEISIKAIYSHIPGEHKAITSVNTVALLYKHKAKFVAIARYDDHDGKDFHKHERIHGKDMQFPVAFKGSPKECLTLAIDDFIKNYQKYIDQYLSNFD